MKLFLKHVSPKLALLAVFFLFLEGCASSHMTVIPDDNKVTKPSSDTALVYFARPSSFGGAIQATVYDDDVYIGTISANTNIAYKAKPGPHMFMVVSESADFMQAELLAGKTYYAEVIARPGVWKARFSFRPNNGQIPDSEVQNNLQNTKQVEPNAEGLKWASENAPSITEKKKANLPKWQAKPEGDKQILSAQSGK